MKSSFFNIINNKKVLLLGPAPHVYSPSKTKDFQEFDVVVKVNKMVEKSSFVDENLNNRNDVLYHCVHIDRQNGDEPYSIEKWRDMKVKHVRMPFSGTSAHYRMNNNRFIKLNKDYNLEFSISPVEVFDELVKNCNYSLPSTGIAAINDLIFNKPRLLDIRGFTFLKTGYNKGYKNEQWKKNKLNRERSTKHNPEKQIEFFKKLYKNNKNIKIDNELLEVINEKV